MLLIGETILSLLVVENTNKYLIMFMHWGSVCSLSFLLSPHSYLFSSWLVKIILLKLCVFSQAMSNDSSKLESQIIVCLSDAEPVFFFLD